MALLMYKPRHQGIKRQLLLAARFDEIDYIAEISFAD